jgi:hypothetical protein
MVRDGIANRSEVHVTFVEGGKWWPLTDIDVNQYHEIYGHPFTAIRRNCICYDFVLAKLGICPWRYVPPLI